MPSLMTCSLIYQLCITPELRRHLRPFNNKEAKVREEKYMNIKDIYELKNQQQQQQKSQKDCLQQIFKKAQYKRRRWVRSCNLITILKQIKLTNPTFDIQQQQQQQQIQQQLQYCQKHQHKQQLLQQNHQQNLLKI